MDSCDSTGRNIIYGEKQHEILAQPSMGFRLRFFILLFYTTVFDNSYTSQRVTCRFALGNI